MAANDAIPATNAKGATDQNTVGTERKSKSPVNLFPSIGGRSQETHDNSADCRVVILHSSWNVLSR